MTCDYLILDAPFPPSQNALSIPVKFGSRCSIGKSKEYKDYQRDTFNPWWLTIRSKGKVAFGDTVIFWTITCPKRNGCDTDNYHKCVLDCLNSAGAFGFNKKNKPSGDNAIVSTRNERGPRVKGGLLRIFIGNERHREALAAEYEKELLSWWLPRREGPILDQPESRRIRRVGMRS